MTTEELRIKFNNEFGLGKWPKIYEVDAETYGNVCNDIINHLVYRYELYRDVTIQIGPNNGIMFKNAELVLSKK